MEQGNKGGLNELIKKVNTVDLFNWVFLALGLGLTASAAVNSSKETPAIIYITILATQTLIGLLIIYLIFVKAKHLRELGEKAKEIENLNNKITVLHNSTEKSNESFRCSMQIISNAIKNNSKHNNERLLQISAETSEAFSHIEEIDNALSLQLGIEKTEEAKELIKKEAKAKIKKAWEKYAADLFTIYKRYCADMVGEIETLETAYLRSKGLNEAVSVSIKLFKEPVYVNDFKRNERNIYTAFRDKKCYNDRDDNGRPKREIGRELYSVEENTDFEYCLTSEHFLINQAVKGSGNYRNQHKDFDRYYNCTVVVPIRVRQQDNRYLIFGYLCSDCKNTKNQEVFDNQSAYFLYMFAQNMAIFLQSMEASWKDRFERFEDMPVSVMVELFNQTRKVFP